MNSLNTTSNFSSIFLIKPKFVSPQLSFSTRRRSSRRLRKTNRHNDNSYNNNPLTNLSQDYENINLVLDFNQISVLTSSKSKFHQFLSSAKEAYTDLQNVIAIDENGRLVVSCRKSTLQFVGSVVLSAFVLVFVFRVLVQLGLGFRSQFGFRKQKFVVRRDRSLGGREVVVGTGDDDFVKSNFNKVLGNPLSEGRVSNPIVSSRVRRSYRVQRAAMLPKWWPVQVPAGQILVVDKEEYQREANRLIRG